MPQGVLEGALGRMRPIMAPGDTVALWAEPASNWPSWLDGADILAVVVFLAFAWAVRGHFRARPFPVGMAGLSALSVVALAALVAPDWSSVAWRSTIAAGLYLGALGLFLASVRATRGQGLGLAFTPEPPSGLVQTGPYRWIRHPFYAAYALYWIGAAVQTAQPLTACLSAILIAAYAVAARREETAFLAGPHAPDYAAYRRRAGLMWPRL